MLDPILAHVDFVQGNPERIDALFPVPDLLYFIEEQIDLAAKLLGAPDDLVVQRLGGLQMRIAQLQVKLNGCFNFYQL